MSVTLLLFEAISGLHINMLKSMTYPVNEVPNLEELANLMGCSIGSLPTTYLGLPLGAKYKATEIWNGVIESGEKIGNMENAVSFYGWSTDSNQQCYR